MQCCLSCNAQLYTRLDASNQAGSRLYTQSLKTLKSVLIIMTIPTYKPIDTPKPESQPLHCRSRHRQSSPNLSDSRTNRLANLLTTGQLLRSPEQHFRAAFLFLI